MMNSTSRFKEHFKVEQNGSIDQFYYSHNHTANSLYCSASSQYCKSSTLYPNQHYDLLQRQSLSTTIDSFSSSTATSSSTTGSSSYSSFNYETNNKCHLKRKARVKTRHPKLKTNFFLSQISTSSSIADWCRKQKSKLFGVC